MWSHALILLLFIFYCNSIVHHKWTRTETMDPNGLFVLEWWLPNSKEITFRATVNTRGYIGVGFSYRTGKMAGADLVLAWVDDRTGKPNVLDCHGPAPSGGGNSGAAPLQDDTQNYLVDNGYQNATHTVIQFRRALETCDPHDLDINSDTIKVLWSFGEKDPIYGGGDLTSRHGTNRGAKSLFLMGPLFRKPTPDVDNNIQQWDVTVKNVSIDTNMDTLYWCKIIRAPILREKHHILGYEVILSKESSSAKPFVHHMTLFECSTNVYPSSDSASWDVWVKSSGAVCNSNLLTPRDWDSCITPIAVWTIGSSGQFFPEHIGVPLGGHNGAKYYMLEIHYDNPLSKRLRDSSGFRIHYTPNLREHDAGMMISGVSISDTQMIPPGQKLYRNVGICGPSCTGSVFPANGISIVSAILHSHIAGRRMKLRHVRNGKELNRIAEDENFDHSYQQVRQLANETIVLPGDFLLTDCSYETIGRKRTTLGGYSTKQEICLSFLTYYPRIDLAGCYSMIPAKEFFETFGVYKFYGLNMTDVENLFLYNGNILDLLPATVFTTNHESNNNKLDGDSDGYHNHHNHNHKVLNGGGGGGQQWHDLSSSSNSNSGNSKTKEFSVLSEEDVLFRESILNKLIISDPVEFHDRTFLSHLNQLPWSEPLFTRKVEETLLGGKYMTFCRVANESTATTAEILKYPNFTQLVKPASHCPFKLKIENVQSNGGGSVALTTVLSEDSAQLQRLIISAGLIVFYVRFNVATSFMT